MLRWIDFLSKALAPNLPRALPLTAASLSVLAAEAGTLEHFGAEVTNKLTEAFVYFDIEVQAILSIEFLAHCVGLIFYVSPPVLVSCFICFSFQANSLLICYQLNFCLFCFFTVLGSIVAIR